MQWGCSLGCCRHRRTGPRADGHACPGSREHRAGGQQTAQSRALAAGRLVSRSGARLTTAPFFPEVHDGADEFVDGPLSRPGSRSSASSVLTTLDVGVARGGRGHSPGGRERSAVHLCPRNAALGGNRPASPVQGL